MRGTHPVEKRERSLPIGDDTGGKTLIKRLDPKGFGARFCDRIISAKKKPAAADF